MLERAGESVPALGRKRSSGLEAQGSGPVSRASSPPSLRFPQPALHITLVGKFRCTDSENLKGRTCLVTGGETQKVLSSRLRRDFPSGLPAVKSRGQGPGHPSEVAADSVS